MTDTAEQTAVISTDTLTPAEIRARRADAPKLRDRDFAEQLGIAEAALVAATVGAPDGPQRAAPIGPHPDTVMALAETLGEVMALTRNPSCVHEKIGSYTNYHSGQHAAMVLTEAIDLRMFPSQWRHAFLVETEAEAGPRRSVQVFDGAGDAVHKIYLRPASNLPAWQTAWDGAASALPVGGQTLDLAPRAAPEAPKSAPDKVEILRKEWERMTDTHQFMRLTAKLKMNRLGAYRIAAAPFVRPLALGTVDSLLHQVRDQALEIMVFTGNRGCIQIHSGPVRTLKPMGPWQNVLDPDFNLHLRLDHIAEVWAVDKPTQRGPAVSVEAFDSDGQLILQIFGVGKEGRDCRPAFGRVVAGLDEAPEARR